MKRKRQIFDFKEFNRILDQVEACSIVHYGKLYEDKPKNQSLTNHSYCKFNPKNVILTTKYGYVYEQPVTYIFTRDDSITHLDPGYKEYGVFSSACGEYLPDYANDEFTIKRLGKKDGKFLNKQTGILTYNKKFEGKEVFAYEYDLNSAYLSCIYEKLPDTREPMFDHVLEEGEIGFLIQEKLFLVTEPGYMVDIAFKLIETPEKIKNYCERWFERKSQKEDLVLKKKAKHQIVDSIGFLQYHNPYLRAYIIESCNNFIEGYIKKYPEDWILANTDAIFLTKEIEANIGMGLGQFKVKSGYMKLNGVNYSSEEFGNKERGKQKANYYEVINNRLVRIEYEEEEEK